jgi:CO/xanthine dehydrogenase Mo-binding subunit
MGTAIARIVIHQSRTPDMAARYLGKPIRRNEDPRLLRGKALFVDDIDRAGMLHGAFLRSSHAHARIVKIDASRAVTVPGVAAVYTAHDLGNYWQSGPFLFPRRRSTASPSIKERRYPWQKKLSAM